MHGIGIPSSSFRRSLSKQGSRHSASLCLLLTGHSYPASPLLPAYSYPAYSYPACPLLPAYSYPPTLTRPLLPGHSYPATLTPFLKRHTYSPRLIVLALENDRRDWRVRVRARVRAAPQMGTQRRAARRSLSSRAVPGPRTCRDARGASRPARRQVESVLAIPGERLWQRLRRCTHSHSHFGIFPRRTTPACAAMPDAAGRRRSSLQMLETKAFLEKWRVGLRPDRCS